MPDPAAPVAGTDVVEPHTRTDALEAFYRLDEGLDDKLEKLLVEIARLRAEVAELRKANAHLSDRVAHSCVCRTSDDSAEEIVSWCSYHGDMQRELTALRSRVAELEVADDFEAMLRKLVHRLRQRPDLPTKDMLDQADDLLRRKGRASILRATPDLRDARIAVLEAALREAREAIQTWGSQASDYAQEKHGLTDDIAAVDRALGDDHG